MIQYYTRMKILSTEREREGGGGGGRWSREEHRNAHIQGPVEAGSLVTLETEAAQVDEIVTSCVLTLTQ